MNSAYNFNQYKGQLLVLATFSSSLGWPLYTDLSVFKLGHIGYMYMEVQ